MIIVGLGNPGKIYAKSRHNTGFMFVDSVAKANNVTFKLSKTLKAMVGELTINNTQHYLIKPITFMNSSGEAVKKALEHYHLDTDDLIVVYDDMDLNIAAVRIRKNGGAGGHNGIKSIIQQIGTQDFKRIRIGISHSTDDTIDYVLGKFTKQEVTQIQEVLEKAPLMIDDLIINGMDYLMNHYNS